MAKIIERFWREFDFTDRLNYVGAIFKCKAIKR